MRSSVASFFARIIDYAGLFPPARLELDEAFRNYLAYMRGANAWMLSRFVIPASGLPELRRLLDDSVRMPLSVIVAPDGTRPPELDAVRTFGNEAPGEIDLSVAESKIPVEAIGGIAELSAYLEDFAAAAEGLFRRVYFEIPGNDVPAEKVALVCEAARACNSSKERGAMEACLKIRCGGADAAAVPEAPFLAHFIEQCVRQDVRYKATAGLHHPHRNIDPASNAPVYGFLNVFGAGILAHTHRLAAGEIEPILREEEPAAFTFSAGDFAWRDRHASVSWIQSAREKSITSFGSCSFTEPVDDLKEMALI